MISIRDATGHAVYLGDRRVSAIKDSLEEAEAFLARQQARYGKNLEKHYENPSYLDKNGEVKEVYHYKLPDGTTGTVEDVTSMKMARYTIATGLERKRVPKGTEIWKA